MPALAPYFYAVRGRQELAPLFFFAFLIYFLLFTIDICALFWYI